MQLTEEILNANGFFATEGLAFPFNMVPLYENQNDYRVSLTLDIMKDDTFMVFINDEHDNVINEEDIFIQTIEELNEVIKKYNIDIEIK